jgi:hypothetical protein
MPFRTLDPAQILATTERLARRIDERFPDRGLAQVAGEVVALARTINAEVTVLAPPIWWLRGLVVLVVLLGGAMFVWVGSIISLNQVGREAMGSVQSIEAAINTGLLAVLGLVALVQLEARVKRRRVARGLHGLRSVIHVIDMHFRPTPHSPSRDMTAPEMSRYLDYCSELLAITGKLAALYAQAVPDEGVAGAVNDIELLGSSLSRKIWQKITLIDTQPAVRRKRVAQ